MVHFKTVAVCIFSSLLIGFGSSCKKSKSHSPVNTGVLYYSSADELMRYDFKTRQETSIFSGGSSYQIASDGGKFVWYKTNFGESSTRVQVHSMQAPAEYQTISIPYLLEGTPKFAPGTALFGALARSADQPINRADLLLFDYDGKTIGNVPHVKDFAFSPSGKDLIISAEAVDGNGESIGYALALIKDYRSEASQSVTLQEFQNYEQLPEGLAVSASGSQLIYTYNKHLYTIQLQSGASAKQITTSRFEEIDAGWSPDGRFLVFTAAIDGDATGCGEIRIVPSDTDNPIQVPEDGYDNAPVDPLQPVGSDGKVIHACNTRSILWLE